METTGLAADAAYRIFRIVPYSLAAVDVVNGVQKIILAPLEAWGNGEAVKHVVDFGSGQNH